MKRSVAIFLLSTIAASHCSLAAGRSESSPLRWSQIGRSEWLIEFTLPEFRLDSVERAGAQWSAITTTGLTRLAVPGEPALPIFAEWIPARIEVSDFEIVEQTTSEIVCAPPLPAPEPMDRALSPNLTYVPSPAIYERASQYPDEMLTVINHGYLGGIEASLLSISPVSYNFLTSTLIVTERLTLRLSVPAGRSLDQLNVQNRRDFQFWQEFCPIPRSETIPEEITQPRLWIVTDSPFNSQLDEWRDFKQSCGIPSEVILFSEVATDAQTLRSYLLQRYEGAAEPAEFLLIVGDYNIIPAFYGVHSSLTDHPYSMMSGQDYLPDVSVGRIPCNTSSQLTGWLARALAYERDGEILSSGTATVFSSSVALDPQHGQQAGGIFGSAGLSVTQLQQPQTGALPLLLNALNTSPLWTFYIGHGSVSSWSSVSPHFTTQGIQQIGDSRASIVVSVACATADFDEQQSSIAEHWSLNQVTGGALCYVGATESTAFFYSDTIGLGTLQAVFNQGIEYLGAALDYGKLRCATSFPQAAGGLTEETIQQFVLLGDPSLRLYTSQPRTIAVNMPELLPIGSTHIPINVTRDGSPLSGAEVILTSDVTFPRVTETDASGFALVSLPFSTSHEWTIRIRGQNSIPVRRQVTVAPIAGPLIQILDVELTETRGDQDGHADRGESGVLRIMLRNAGTMTAGSGVLRLQISGTGLAITPQTLQVPSMPSQSEDWLDATATYSIGSLVPDRSVVSIQAWFERDGESQFAGSRTIVLQAPAVELVSQALVEVEGDGDREPEGGEMLGLELIIRNRGGESLRGIAVDCFPSHDYLHIEETRWSRDSLMESETDTVTFLFRCDSLTPRGYPFEYNATLTSLNGDTTVFWGRHRIGQVPVLLYVLDSYPQQLPGLIAALNVLRIEYETCQQLPPDLSRYKSIWIFCGVHPNEQSLSNQAAQRLASYLDDGGSCYWEGGDVWAFDSPTVLHPYFGINGLSDGVGDAGPLSGVRGRFTEGMSFTYSGENSYIDRIEPIGSAIEVLRNSRDNANYTVCVANSSANYRTVGCSVELGALNDLEAPSTRVHLVREILLWLGISVLHDIHPPVITHVPVTEWRNPRTPIPILADVQDESEIDFVACDYRVNGGSPVSIVLQRIQEGYFVELPAQTHGTRVRYRLRAADQSEPQNTVVTDEYELLVSNWSDRVRFVVSEYETLPAMRRRGSTGLITLVPNEEQNTSVVLMNNRRGNVSSYVTESLDLTAFSMPEISLCSRIAGENSREAVIARILASTDGGLTFPHLIWRQGPVNGSELENIRESNLTALLGQANVVLKFLYYGDRFWELSRIEFKEAAFESSPVSQLVVVPGENITLMWQPAKYDSVEYKVYASSTAGGPYALIATTGDTTFEDKNWRDFDQRFYRVESGKRSSETGGCLPARFSSAGKVARSFERRR